MAWTALDGRTDSLAIFDRILSSAALRKFGTWEPPADGSVRHMAITRTRWRTRHYLDGERVRRWHPYVRALRRNRFAREMLKP